MSTLEVFLGLPPEIEPVPEPETLVGKNLSHLSASSIGMVLRCPRQFYRRYILGEKQRPGESLVIGSIFHETLEWNYRTKILSGEDQPISDALQYLQDAAVPKVLEEEGGEENVMWDEGSGVDNARSESERITTAYYRTVVPRIQPAGVEERFDIYVPGVEVPIIGYVDVRDKDRIIDSKTGKQATRRVKPSWQLQGRLYAQARKMPVEFHSISRAKTPTIVTGLESADMVVNIPTDGQARNMAHTLKAAADMIEYYLATYGTEQEWPALGAVPDFTRTILPCDFCGWREGCPAWAA
jgi:RecB family exonuclease